MFYTRALDQGWFLPPLLHEFVPAGHMAHFVRNMMREALDLTVTLDTYAEERGYLSIILDCRHP